MVARARGERARALLPAHHAILFSLAKLYARVGRVDEARAAMRRVATWSHGEMDAEAEALLEEIGESEPEPDAADPLH